MTESRLAITVAIVEHDASAFSGSKNEKIFIHHANGYIVNAETAIAEGKISEEDVASEIHANDIAIGEMSRQCLLFMAHNGYADKALKIIHDGRKVKAYASLMMKKGCKEAEILPQSLGLDLLADAKWHSPNGGERPRTFRSFTYFKNHMMTTMLDIDFHTALTDNTIRLHEKLPESVMMMLSRKAQEKAIRPSEIFKVSGIDLDAIAGRGIHSVELVDNHKLVFSYICQVHLAGHVIAEIEAIRVKAGA